MKRIIKYLIYPITFFIGQFLINYFFVFLFNQHQLRLLSNNYPFLSHKQLISKLNQLIKTSQYKLNLSNYMNSKALIIILITSIIFIPLFYNIYKKYKNHNITKIKKNDVLFIILLGISISLIFNITLSSINYFLHFTNNYQLSQLPIYIQILSSGIMGPIIEELLFRGIVYNKIKEDYKPMKSIIISSIIFSLFHFSNPLNVLYAFMMSFMFIYLYEKYKTLWAPILLHCIANTSTILIIYLIVMNIIWLNMIIVLIMIVILIILHKLIIKNDLK